MRTILASSLALLALLGAAAAGLSFDLTNADMYTFEDYLLDFPEKQYQDAVEQAMREAIFQRRLAEIQHHNTHLAGKSKGYRKVMKGWGPMSHGFRPSESPVH